MYALEYHGSPTYEVAEHFMPRNDCINASCSWPPVASGTYLRTCQRVFI